MSLRKISIFILFLCVVFFSCKEKKISIEEAEEKTGVYYIRIMMDLKKYNSGEMSFDDFKLYTSLNLEKIRKVLENTDMSENYKRILMNTFEMYCASMTAGEGVQGLNSYMNN